MLSTVTRLTPIATAYPPRLSAPPRTQTSSGISQSIHGLQVVGLCQHHRSLLHRNLCDARRPRPRDCRTAAAISKPAKHRRAQALPFPFHATTNARLHSRLHTVSSHVAALSAPAETGCLHARGRTPARRLTPSHPPAASFACVLDGFGIRVEAVRRLVDSESERSEMRRLHQHYVSPEMV